MLIPLVTHPDYSYEFPSGHRFPMEKFGLLLTYLQSQNIATQKNIFRPGEILLPVLKHTHCPQYVDRFMSNTFSPKELKDLGLPWSNGLVKRSLISPNGTLLTAHLALKHGVACHLAGGTHHAYKNRASGFCIFNDLAVTANALIWQKKANKVLIFDCDVHQGDGTASILKNEPNAMTVSIHCRSNFPNPKEQSDMDVALPSGTGDSLYLKTVEETLSQVLLSFRPDIVLYDAGVDVYQDDPLGRLNISIDGIWHRDRTVLEMCRDQSIPVATVIGGGYDNDRLSLAKRHGIVIEVAAEIWRNAV